MSPLPPVPVPLWSILSRLRQSIGHAQRAPLTQPVDNPLAEEVLTPESSAPADVPAPPSPAPLWPPLPPSDDPDAWSPAVAQQIRDFLSQAVPLRLEEGPSPAAASPAPPAPDFSSVLVTTTAPDDAFGNDLVDGAPRTQPNDPIPPRDSPSGSPLDNRSDWTQPMYVRNRPTSEWVGLFRELGPLASSVLLDILDNPDRLAARTDRATLLNQMRSALPVWTPDPSAPTAPREPAKKKSGRGRTPITIKDPHWDEIYRAIDLLLLLAQQHRPFSYFSAAPAPYQQIIQVGQGMRYCRPAEGVVLAQVADPVAGRWIPVKVSGPSRGSGRWAFSGSVDVRAVSWTPTAWPILSLNNSSSVESAPSRLVLPLRDILAERQADLRPEFAAAKKIWMGVSDPKPSGPGTIDQIMAAAAPTDKEKEFNACANRVDLVLHAKWNKACLRRRANKGDSVKAWWNSFVPRDVLSVLIAVCGSSKHTGFSWLDVSTLSTHPDRAAILERVAELGPERKMLSSMAFDAWSTTTTADLLARARIPAEWVALWPQVRTMPDQAATALFGELENMNTYRPDSYVSPLRALADLPVARFPMPAVSADDDPSDDLALNVSSSPTKKMAFGIDWVQAGGYGRSGGYLPYDSTTRTTVLATASALIQEIGEDDASSLRLAMNDLWDLPEKMPPRGWEMLARIAPSAWGEAFRTASAVPVDFTADPSRINPSFDLKRSPELLARARALCVQAAVRLTQVWPVALPDRYRTWGASDQGYWGSDVSSTLRSTAQKINKKVLEGSDLTDVTLVDVFHPGDSREHSSKLMAAHEQMVLKSLLPKRKRGRPRKNPLPDSPDSPAHPPARRRTM